MMASMPTGLRYAPCPELVEVLAPAYRCRQFDEACAGNARWDPSAGFVPRGFIGALGRLRDVRLVLLLAEPGNGLPGETHPFDGDPRALIEDLGRYVFEQFDRRPTLFHRNIRYILDQCWPGTSLREQLTRTWVTETYLCSAVGSTAPVPLRSWTACRRTYLEPQLELLCDRVIVALGGKAWQRAPTSTLIHRAFSPAPPGCNQRGARASWDAVGALVRQKLA